MALNGLTLKDWARFSELDRLTFVWLVKQNNGGDLRGVVERIYKTKEEAQRRMVNMKRRHPRQRYWVERWPVWGSLWGE